MQGFGENVFVYKDGSGKLSYSQAGSDARIKGFAAFGRRLPTKWSHFAYAAVLILIGICLVWPLLIGRITRLLATFKGTQPRRPVCHVCVFYRGVAVMLAFIFLVAQGCESKGS